MVILLQFTYSEREGEEREIKMPSIIHKQVFIPSFSELYSDWVGASSFQQIILLLDGLISFFSFFFHDG